MIDVTFLAMVVGFALAGLVPQNDQQRGAAWTLGDWVELAVAATFGVVLAVYVWRFVGADLRLAPMLPNGAGGAAVPGLDADDLRALVSAALPSLLFGALAGYLLRRAVQQLDVKLLLGAALTLLFPSLISVAPHVADYVNEVKTPWFEAKLINARPEPPPVLSLVSPGRDEADLNEGAYRTLLRGLGSHADLADPKEPPKSPGRPPDLPASDRLAYFSGSWPAGLFPQAAELRTVELWLNAYVGPLLACDWQQGPYPWSSTDVWQAPARHAAALLHAASEQAALGRQLDGVVRASLTTPFVDSIATAVATCRPELVLPAWEHSQCGPDAKADYCRYVPFLEPDLLARSAVPYIAVARLYRRSGQIGSALRFLDAIDPEPMAKTEQARLLLERSAMRSTGGRIDDALADQLAAVAAYQTVLSQLDAHSNGAADDLACPVPDSDPEMATLFRAYAEVTYQLAQTRNSYLFEAINDLQRKPERDRGAAVRQVLLLASSNLNLVPRLMDYDCVIGTALDAPSVYADTYALALLVAAANIPDRRQDLVQRALDLLDRAERAAMDLGPGRSQKLLRIYGQHREAAQVLL